MTKGQKKVVQYLAEAHATEQALVRVLQSQIAMTPRGSYRSALETHLNETRGHADRVARRLRELGHGESPLHVATDAVQTVVGQLLAVGKAPIDLLRGSGGEEKVLKNAKDACATEALEIATYTAIERLAKKVRDEQTAELAASILGDEERMYERVLREIPKLTDAVFNADVKGEGSYDISTTGTAEELRDVADAVRGTARQTVAGAKRASRQARKVPGVAQVEGQIKGAVASEEDLPIPGYDDLNADEIVAKLSELSQIDLAKVDSYERKHEGRTTILSRISSLRGDEPWPGYDELTAAEVVSALSDGGDEQVARQVRDYERAHKGRATVLRAAERELATA
jgi:ferritin-like metal-binding protein YciE/Asp-tRNA(Asn)/Glu-tRNA(Gln) amidotransferase C subunit